MNLRKASEVAGKLILEHDPVPDAIGFRLSPVVKNGAVQPGRWAHTWDGSVTRHTFASGFPPYTVEALLAGDRGVWPPPAPAVPVYPFGSGGLSDFRDTTQNGSEVTVMPSDFTAGKKKLRFHGNAATTWNFDGGSFVRVHMIGSSSGAIEAMMNPQGQTFYRCLSFRRLQGSGSPVMDEIHSAGSSKLAAGPVPLNQQLRSGHWAWLIRGATNPNSSSFIGWTFGQPVGDENSTNRFSQGWQGGISDVVTDGEWVHSFGKWVFAPSADAGGRFRMHACRHGQPMTNIVPEISIGTCFASPITHYPMLSLYYPRSVAGDQVVEFCAGGYCADERTLKTWQADQLGYDPWATPATR